MGAYGNFGAIAGVMLGSAVGTLVTTLLPREEVHAWGWRIPFFLGITIGLAGYFLRREITRTAAAHQSMAPPLAEVLSSQWQRIMQVAGFKGVGRGRLLPHIVYATTYLVHIVGIPKHNALAMNTISVGALLLLIPLFGIVSNVVGRKPVLLTSPVGTLLLAWPLFRLMQHHEMFSLDVSPPTWGSRF
jgi:MFS transporter, MHS family, proline/betaine transporter